MTAYRARSLDYLPDVAIEWAQNMINEFHLSSRELAEKLGVNRRTLDRRLQDRLDTFHRWRCHICGTLNENRRHNQAGVGCSHPPPG